ncbi:hypothetical protein QQS21_008229 [Conoideocrella luteorostrata]|uniref:Uncharacterized protein n=1 Tax=Conoideocrella luteorostrata TaxID=1105319 RepID=A0AAJ0CJ91_9HYPO|nr:hypothetical protein QQS21_008229 [Conoideocrella luteorostrata]
MAHITSNMLLHRFRQLQLGATSQSNDRQPSDETGFDDGFYRPTPIDIIVTRIMLMRSIKLPADLVDAVFDYAEYWAHSTNVIDYQAEHQDSLRIVGSSPEEDKFLLRSYPVGLTGIEGGTSLAKELAYDTREAKPLPRNIDCDPTYFAKMAKYPTPRLLNPVRKVVFTIKSHDQGWSNRDDSAGTYKASSTWFEAGLERFDAEQTCNAQCTRDVRQELAESKPPALPVCGIRPVHPKIRSKRSSENAQNLDNTAYAGDDETHMHGNANNAYDEDEYEYIHPLEGQPEWEIQRNRTATREWQEKAVTWSYLDDVKANSDAGKALDDEGRGRATGDGSFVRNLRMGDVVTVWGKARFPSWVNSVDYVKIDVYWAV